MNEFGEQIQKTVSEAAAAAAAGETGRLLAELRTPRPGLPATAEIGVIIEHFHRAGRMAWELGFDFVDIKHCHGYLGHEFLSAHTREGLYRARGPLVPAPLLPGPAKIVLGS